jgi:hypothetical protein
MNLHREGYSSRIERLRRALPIAAYPRQALLAFLSSRGVAARGAPRLSVIDVFNGGDVHGLMCRFVICGDMQARIFVAPLSQIAFSRKHPAARSLARFDCSASRAGAA